MKFSQRDLDGTVAVDIHGKMTGGPEAEEFRNLFKSLVAEGKADVIINLKDVDWISSTGIGIMIRGYQTVCEAGGRFILVHVGDRTKQIFNVMRLYDIFKIFETEDEALEFLAAS